MSKMGSHDPFGHQKHKLWPKEGPKVKLAIWLPTTKKSGIDDFLAFRWRATWCLRALDEGYNFGLDLIPIGGLHTKLWGAKVAGIPTLVISGLPFGPFGSPETKSHLDEGLAERCIVYYMGEGGGFPRVRAVLSLVNLRSPVARFSTKSAPTMH
jgi:hypothetical protein